MNRIIHKFLIIIVAILFSVILFLSIEKLPQLITYNNHYELFMYIVLGIFGAVFLYLLLEFLLSKEIYNKNIAWVILGIIIITIQCFFAIRLKTLLSADGLSVYAEAFRMVTEGDHIISSQNNYFNMYGNNNCFVLILYFAFSILKFLHIGHYYAFSVLLSVLCIDLGIVICCYLVNKILGKEACFSAAFLFAISPYTYVYCRYVYTITFSLLFTLLEILIAYKIYISIKNTRWKKIIFLSVLEGIITFFALKIRATSFIATIAIGIIAILFLLFKKNYSFMKRTLAAFVIVISFFVISFYGYRVIENNYVNKEIRADNFPVCHWIMMGHNAESNGKYTYADAMFTESYGTKKEKEIADINLLKKRISDMGIRGVCLL